MLTVAIVVLLYLLISAFCGGLSLPSCRSWIMAVPRSEHTRFPTVLSAWARRAWTDALRSRLAMWFPVRGSLFFAGMSFSEVIPAKTGSECTVVNSCFKERSCPLLHSSLSWCGLPFVDETDVLDCACDQGLGSSATCYLYMLHVHSALPRMLIVYSC